MPTESPASPSSSSAPDLADMSGREALSRRHHQTLSMLRESGQLKVLETIDSPMDATVTVQGFGDVACFCSNNYLGLANHPKVVRAGRRALQRYGAGTASVRFICGTFTPHVKLEKRIAEFLDVEAAYTFVSCWNATEALFPTLCEAGDIIVSDELNHACIIDAMRLTQQIKKGVHKAVYRHSDMGSLRQRLEEARANSDVTGVIFVITDGVFSMEGDLARLPDIRGLCDEFGAILVVDDSHGTGVMGATGRGTHEHFNMQPEQIDIFTGTLGKALGGAAGGYVAGPQHVIDMLIQRGRPTLFSNALPVTVAASARRAISVLMKRPELVEKLRNNVAYARQGIKDIGFDVLESPTAICPIIVHDTARAIAMSRRLLELGCYVIGFGFPVVPEGEARLRVQISAAHEQAHLDALIEALGVVKREFA